VFRIVDLFQIVGCLVLITIIHADKLHAMAPRSAQPQHERMAAPGLPRITTPMVRDDGTLRPATWDEALDRASRGLGAARSKITDCSEPNAFGMFSCSKATNEVNYLAQKFARMVMGSNNIDSCNRT
jgi:formate dehydrogenase (hydrogenase)